MSRDSGRLAWRCRRGTRELDLILGRFLERGYSELDVRQRELFERLLDCEDDRLQLWLLSSEEPADAELAEIVEIVRQPR
ncbi:MAG TPA: succinate dehydrogenase assembly factor 2 [Gammaproteobacteria bacterium]|nr:succinate dehydrogenase assembly factor 2 [Gammaproteobacteria bacterium]